MVTFLNFGDFSLIHFLVYLIWKCRIPSFFVDLIGFIGFFNSQTLFFLLIGNFFYFTFVFSYTHLTPL